jgi:UDP-N-acetyl-D-mannosaminuronate dehydrogenase
MKKKIGILGYGEVGQAIAKFYGSARASTELSRMSSPQVKIKDLNRNDGLKGVDVLHVCLPWTDKFIEIVKKEIKEIKPKLTIIHSTVAPGTTLRLAQGKPKIMLVHSPIRGIHPHLYEGIKVFVKYIGADDKKAGEMAKKHLESIGIKTKVFYPSTTTEIGKLLDTTYYGLVIAWHGEMKKLCDKYKIDFNEAVTDFNQTYNQGYKKLGKLNVIRPVLYPPENGITGHCVLPNAEILKKHFKSQAIDLLLNYKPKNK